MAGKVSPEQWSHYLSRYKELSRRLSDEPWFSDGWETRSNTMGGETVRGVWFQLVRLGWFDGAIHLETWLNNAVLQRKSAPLVLHIETSIPKHGISRNDFTQLFLEKSGEILTGWPGYEIKPNYAQEPFSVQVAFTEETLVPELLRELNRVRQLGPTIDEVIAAVKR